MPESSRPFFPVLKIAALVDATTAVIVGDRLDDVGVGDELYVLGVGSSIIPDAEVPLVVPKVTLEVSAHAGKYVLARTLVEEETVVAPALSVFREMFEEQRRTLVRRKPIVEGKFDFIGNPGMLPVKVGDVVVRSRELSDYVNWLAQTRKS